MPQQKKMEAISQLPQGTVMVMMPQTALEELKAGINELKTMLQGRAVEDANSMWIESEDARQMLGVSPRTWQTMRDKKALPFSQYGRKIYVRRADIEAFLQEHMITSDGRE